MENESQNGARSSKLSVDALGAIPNLLDKMDLEKIIVRESSWSGVISRLIESKLYQRINGNAIARVLLLAWQEKLEADSLKGKIADNAANLTLGHKATERSQAIHSGQKPRST